jgi:hypothetical protein
MHPEWSLIDLTVIRAFETTDVASGEQQQPAFPHDVRNHHHFSVHQSDQ